MDSAIPFLFQIAILVFSVVIHEVSHGYAALALGDKTAQYAGRLTLNPIPHIDPFGSILLPLLLSIPALFGQPTVLIGWAKPVPYNPNNLRNRKWGPALVGIAGPGVNILLAVFFGLLMRFVLNGVSPATELLAHNFLTIAGTIAFLNIMLAFFNLVPVPPLDGSKVLFAILPYRWRSVQWFLEQYGFFILFGLIFLLGFGRFIFQISAFFFRLITGTVPF